MDIRLTPELQERVHKFIDGGGYAETKAVLNEALTLMIERIARIERSESESKLADDRAPRWETSEFTPTKVEPLPADERARQGRTAKH